MRLFAQKLTTKRLYSTFFALRSTRRADITTVQDKPMMRHRQKV